MLHAPLHVGAGMGNFQYHSHTGHAAYHDLLRMLRDETVSDLRGTPVCKKIGNRHYWYDRYRLGNRVVEKYIGEDSGALKSRLARHTEIKSSARAAERERARLVRLLRAEGYLPADVANGQILTALARAGTFRLGGTLIGTQAFHLYEGELGVRIAASRSAMTKDKDIASAERLSLALNDHVDPALSEVFSDFSFDPVPGIDRPGDVWRWRQTNQHTLVEFLTPSFEADEGIRELSALGVKARALHHLNYLIAGPIQAAVLYRRGALVQIPRPERFAVHKLIVADRRREGPDASKSIKDREQAAFLIQILAEDQPDALAEAYEDAWTRGPAWRVRIENSLRRLSETAKILNRLLS